MPTVRLGAALLLAASPCAAGGAMGLSPSSPSDVTATTAPDAPAEEIVVTAQRANATQVLRGGPLGVLGDLDAADAPFTLKGYSEALILNQQPLTLGAVLENDPAVRTTYGFGNAAEQFVIRGFPLFSDDIGLDGLYGLTPRQLVAPELYEQVQVLTGASAFLNGAAPGGTGIGGSVNLIPKRAGNDPLARVTLNYLSRAHAGGSFDVARRLAGGSLGVRINGAARAGDVAIDDEYRSAYVLGAAVDWQGERGRLFADLAWQRVTVRHLRPKVTIGAGVPAVPRADANYGQPWTYTRLRDLFGLVRGEYDLSDSAMLYASAGARDGSERGVYDGITVTDAVTGAATGSALFVPRTDNNEAAQAGLRLRAATGAVTHRINLGGSMVWQVNRNAFDFLGGFPAFTTNLYQTPVVPLPGSFFVGGNLADPFPISRTRLSSLFASDTIGLAGDRVLLTAGARLQRIRVQSYSYADGSPTTRYDRSAVTPVVGLVVKPADGLSLYANRIEGLAQGPVAPTDPTLVNPGETFAPFRSVQYEAGAKLLGLGSSLNLTLGLFRTSQPSAFAVAADPANPTGPRRFGLNGQQRNQGVEVSLDGEPLPGLRVIAGASYIDATLRRTAGGTLDGKRAPGVPDWLLNANVEWDVGAVPGLTLTARGVHTGGQAVDQANLLSIPAWTRVDLGVRQVIALGDRPLTLRAGVDNVANRRVWASAFSSFGTSLLQGSPRTWRLSASYAF